jgi:hypothetical protein
MPSEQPKPRVRTPRKSRAHYETRSRAAVTKIILDDLTSPLVPADAAELFAVMVMDHLKEMAPDIIAKFDRSWFDVFVDLAVAVTNRCAEDDVRKTLEAIERAENKDAETGEADDKLRARVLRRRFARSLPPGAVNQLDDTGRYWLSMAAIAAARDLVKDQSLWDAMWGRKTGWFPTILIAKEAPDAGGQD